MKSEFNEELIELYEKFSANKEVDDYLLQVKELIKDNVSKGVFEFELPSPRTSMIFSAAMYKLRKELSFKYRDIYHNGKWLCSMSVNLYNY